MRFLTLAASLLSISSIVCGASNETVDSRVLLPKDFSPPQVFKHVNLVRNTNLEKGYVRETINVVVENQDKEPQSTYYIPFPSDVFGRVGGLQVRDKKDSKKTSFPVTSTELVESDSQYFRVDFPEPLAPSSQITLSISYHILGALNPLPKSIGQGDAQYLVYSFSAYTPSAYKTDTQKTKIKFPNSNVPDYTKTDGLKSGNDPEKQGSSITYGPYENVAPGVSYPIQVRFESTKPVVAATLERDVEVSHWGGNIAFEERYWLRHEGAKLAKHFDRVDYVLQTYTNAPTSALRELKYTLKPGSVDPYFTDDIGNVSTSRFRPGSVSDSRDAHLELRPRYPLFGGWKYSFRVGWNNDLSRFLRQLGSSSDSYILKVPLLEGPRNSEGIQYDAVTVRIILPEGSTDVAYEIPAGSPGLPHPAPPAVMSSQSIHRTYMDTRGRTVLNVFLNNLADETRDAQIIVTYKYTVTAALRKPLTIASACLVVFVSVWIVGKLDVGIRKR
ncbi:hypothetical protein VTN49DRAFT_3399 [Thermomyces lanuginosus]|uniref:uncharacterized protein n=1 Tax=Thermomyces lanuginosus TaxID=5541 RepID=UPI0037448BBE